MAPSISEFSFGYALTEAFVKNLKGSIVGAPLFPTLRKEGKVDGGFDLKLKGKIGFPIFLQFKLTHKMKSSNVDELIKLPGKMNVPFFRLHLMPTGLSRQHNSLLKLDDGKNHVFYVAPFFYTEDELNKYYEAAKVLEESFFIKPNSIGKLPDNKNHHISLEYKAKHGFLFSNNLGEEVDITSSDQLMSEIEQAIKVEETDVEEKIEIACKALIKILIETKSQDIVSYSSMEPNFGLLQTISNIYFGALVVLITKKK